VSRFRFAIWPDSGNGAPGAPQGNQRIYKLRWRIENAFNSLKDFKRAATRYDKLARNYLAFVCLAADLDLMSPAPPEAHTRFTDNIVRLA
jgi:transposase